MALAVALVLLLSSVQFIECGLTRFDAETDVLFRLYTRSNPTEHQALKVGDLAILEASNFDLKKPLKIFTHGWTQIGYDKGVVDGFLDWSDVNVVLVDWTKGTTGPESEVVANAPSVGILTAAFIDWLSTLGIKHADVHVVGMSLGCHVAGWAGRSCQKGKLGYLTACDPSRKFWDDSDNKVNAGDAVYVEVIHSSTFHHGLIYPTGTADFYPNGGSIMPGCINDFNHLCSHMRSLDYFMDSLDHQKFVSQKCNDYDEIVNENCANIGTSYLGGSKPKNISGIYYLTTNDNKPFYKG